MILLSPFPRPMRNGKRNPKEYPWWPELVALLPGRVLQLGVAGEPSVAGEALRNAPLAAVRSLIHQCGVWIAVDNFLQHMAHQLPKPGAVLWGKSDPNIFGYPENLNLLKSRSCLRERQFDIWEPEPYDPQVFVAPQEVLGRIQKRWPELWCAGAGETA
jgi:ADP-heptose:LPS heptosyltransferase